MTAQGLVQTLRARGITLEALGDRLRVVPADAVKPAEVEALRQFKAEIIGLLARPAAQLTLLPSPQHVDAYKAALRECWRLMALGRDADPDACRVAINEVVRIEDEVGEPRATELRRAWEAEWHADATRCPRCGEPGERHEEGTR